MMQKMKRFWREEDGLVAIEYGLMATLIALAIIVGAGLLGTGLDTMFTEISHCFDNPPSGRYCG